MKRLGALLGVGLFFFGTLAKADDVEDVCRGGTWSNCGNAIISKLNARPSSPAEIVRLVLLWSNAFGKQYDILRRQGRIETSTPDSEKIREAIEAKLNPLEIARDAATNALIKRWLPRVASVLEWADKPLAVALKAFFNSSEIATDYDELRLMNDGVQQKAAELLDPWLKPAWKDMLNQAATAAAPTLTRP